MLTLQQTFHTGVQYGVTLHTGHKHDTWACLSPVLTLLKQYVHSINYCCPIMTTHMGLLAVVIRAAAVGLALLLLTDLSLVVQVKLSIFICKYTQRPSLKAAIHSDLTHTTCT